MNSSKNPFVRSTVSRLCSAMLALCGACLAMPAFAQEAPGAEGPAAPAQLKPAPIPLSQSLGVALDQAIPVASLGIPAVTNADLVAQDAREAGDAKPMRYGVGRDVPAGLVQWRAFPVAGGGTLFVTDVYSPTANGLRLHFAGMDLPKSAQLVVYKVGDAFLGGPYSGQGLHDSGEMWSATIFDELVRVECFIPESDQPAGAAPPVTIDNVQHIYRDMNQLNDIILPQEGNCYNDVTCYPAWNNVAHAAAGIGFIQNNVSLYCSGTMLNAQNSDLTPYWLTAHHCLSTANAAQTSEIFWFFQTSACNGAPPALSSVPRSAVCTLLSTNASSDYTLLLINGSLPGGVFWAGWNTNVANGAAVTCIHHPGGAYKRISFGTKSSVATCGANHITSNWTGLSFTEPGSSGSGLFRDDTQQLVGQLHCGPSVCGTGPANRYDGYGAFATTYGAISGLLNGGSDDGFEPNDSCAGARFLGGIGNTNNSGLVVKSTSADWYSFNVPAGGTFSATINFTHAYGDTDMQLYNGCGGSAVASSTGTTDSETITYVNPGGATTLYLNVYLFRSTRNIYRMDTSVVGLAPGNDNCDSAYNVGPGTYNGSTVSATNDGGTNCGTFGAASNDVWYKYTATGTGTITVDTCGSNYDTVLSVHSACPGNAINTLACNDDNGGVCGGNPPRQSALTTNVTQGTTYLIRIGGFNGANGNYTFHLSANVVTTPPTNNDCASASAIGTGDTAFNTFGATTDGPVEAACNFFGDSQVGSDIWFTYFAACSGDTTVSLCGSTYDSKVAIYDGGCPSAPNTAIACNDDFCGVQSTMTFTSVRSHLYLIRVGGYVGRRGSGNINIACTPIVPGNNNCANAFGIGDGVVSFDTNNATTDGPSEGFCNDVANNRLVNQDLWYVYTATCTGTATASLCGSEYDTKLAAYPSAACPGGPNTAIACNDDFCNGTRSQITFPVTAGSEYLVRVGGYLSSVGAGQLTMSCSVPTCGPDFNGDGILNSDDLSDFITGYFDIPADPATDFNGDTVINSDDLSDFITAYFNGCP